MVPAVARTQRPVQLRKMSTRIQAVASEPVLQRPDDTGRFGRFGGKYVPETLITALAELEQAYAEAINDPAFTVSQQYCVFLILVYPTPHVWLTLVSHHFIPLFNRRLSWNTSLRSMSAALTLYIMLIAFLSLTEGKLLLQIMHIQQISRPSHPSYCFRLLLLPFDPIFFQS